MQLYQGGMGLTVGIVEDLDRTRVGDGQYFAFNHIISVPTQRDYIHLSGDFTCASVLNATCTHQLH